jgi:peptide-methionine (R)-S-oxide reductase
MNHFRILHILMIPLLGISMLSCGQQLQPDNSDTPMSEQPKRSEEEWQKILTPEQYRILRECGTERAFTGVYWDHHEKGTYTCAACGEPLFSSDTKYDSGSGWPSYHAPLNDSCVGESHDRSHGMVRTEIHCAKCGGHLGHVFSDGPAPTGLRYCVNSASLGFMGQENAPEGDD